MTKQLKLSALVAALLASASVFAAKPGYLADQSTDAVSRNNYGECWKTSSFDKEKDGLVECGDKELPPPVVEVPKPAPTLVAVKEKVSFSDKVLFDFNKSTLRSDAKSELDPLAARLKGDRNLKSVEITGHTDFMGTEKYNLVLSERRANAVMSYLQAAGVPSDKMTAIGKGKTEAVMTKECKAKKFKRRADLKACIAPDRHVDIDINTAKEVLVEEKAK